jgi:signal transduction histidine kinase
MLSVTQKAERSDGDSVTASTDSWEDRIVAGPAECGNPPAISQEATERRRDEVEMLESTKHLSLALLAQQAGTWVWDTQNDRVVWDDRMQIMAGLEPGSFGGTTEDWKRLIHPDDLGSVMRVINAALGKGNQFDVTYRVTLPNRDLRYLKLQSLISRNDKGRPVRVVGICLDDTVRFLAEKELESALEKLRSSNQELEQFAYVASHDLQEPLRMIGSYLELLEKRYRERLEGDALEFISYAVEGANGLKRMINDLLAYSRVARRGEEFTPTDCDRVVGQAVHQLGGAIQERHAEVDYGRLPSVPQVKISAIEREGYWEFAVADNGIGIEPQFFERVFVIFKRLNNKQSYPGSGIGLSLCRKIVERHLGEIWIKSKPGEGTTFFFTLPKVVLSSGTPGKGELNIE